MSRSRRSSDSLPKDDLGTARPAFSSWKSYSEFSHAVRFNRRYVFDQKIQLFLEAVLATSRRRRVTIRKGTILFRAQRGVRLDPPPETRKDGDPTPQTIGLGADRMKPDPEHAADGRVRPAGICALYLASSKQTAISEIRPWVGSEISVGYFEIIRDLNAIDLSVGHGEMAAGELTFGQLLGHDEVDPKVVEKAVWIDIDNAFSRPLTRESDPTEYVPTQILAELLRDAGYEAIIYRSQFGKGDTKGFNVALFDCDDAEIVACEPHQVTRIAVTSEEIGNPWYRSEAHRTAGSSARKRARRSRRGETQE